MSTSTASPPKTASNKDKDASAEGGKVVRKKREKKVLLHTVLSANGVPKVLHDVSNLNFSSFDNKVC